MLEAGKEWSWARIRLIKDEELRIKKLEEQCYKCPVAISLNRIFNTTNSTAEYYRLTANGVVHRTPELVSDWMSSFDYGFDVQPFSYELENEKIN